MVILAATKDITSTEKLLDVIRGKNTDSFITSEKPLNSSSKKSKVTKKGKSVPTIFADKKVYTVGVDTGHGVIRLCKTTRANDGRPVLVDYKIVSYTNVARESSEFNEILKSSLNSFCGNQANCNIWVLMSAADVNVQHIKIPRVAKKQLENAVYWTAKKENPFDENDSIFDFELQGEVVDQGIPKYNVVAYTAPKAEVEKVKKIFSDIGINLAGITISPFAIQNLLRAKMMPVSEGAIASLFIGNDFSRIDIYNRENLVMSRGIKTGISSMLESIAETINENNNSFKIEREDAKKILFSIGPEPTKLTEKDAGFGLTEKEIYEMILPALERLVRQVERTLEHHTSVLGFEKVGKIYVSSTMNVYEPILQYISEQLGVKSEIFDVFKQQKIHQADENMSILEKMSLVPVFGLSCSDNSTTLNFIFTYQQKNKEISIKKLNNIIFSVFALALIIVLLALGYKGLEAKSLNDKLANQKQKLLTYNPLITKQLIDKLTDEVTLKRQTTDKYAERYLYLAAIGEISDITPVNIRLINFKIDSANKTNEKTAKGVSDRIMLEGLVSGERNMLDSFLAQYIMKLNNSPMLTLATLEKSNIIKLRQGESLQFTLNAKIGK
jgi:Tfp pilus assembly PilM family ATPase